MYWDLYSISLNGDIGIGTSSTDEKLTVYDAELKYIKIQPRIMLYYICYQTHTIHITY